MYHAEPEKPAIITKLINFAAAVARYVASGCENVTPEQYAERLLICDACPFQRHSKCLVCGCSVELKAMMRSERCPKEPPFWPDLS